MNWWKGLIRKILYETFRNWRYDLVIKWLLSLQRIWVQFLIFKSGDSQTPVTSAPVYPIFSCSFHRHCNHVHTHTSIYTYIHIYIYAGKILESKRALDAIPKHYGTVSSALMRLHNQLYFSCRRQKSSYAFFARHINGAQSTHTHYIKTTQ